MEHPLDPKTPLAAEGQRVAFQRMDRPGHAGQAGAKLVELVLVVRHGSTAERVATVGSYPTDLVPSRKPARVLSTLMLYPDTFPQPTATKTECVTPL